MAQNRNKLIQLLIGDLSNVILHEILSKAIDDEIIREHYSDELKVSFDKARIYREKINPPDAALPEKDVNYIRDKIIKKVKAELQLRISKGYENIDINLVENAVEEVLNKVRAIKK